MIATSISIHTPGLNAEEKAAIESIGQFANRHRYSVEHRMGAQEFCESFGLSSTMSRSKFATSISRIGRATVSIRVVDSTRTPSALLLAGGFGFFESIFYSGSEVTFCVSRYLKEDLVTRVR